ncbi:glycoside hydrolase family 15 protein [Cellulomonas sp. JH27-2]|uniref:glycoside hydrolase family 15 protein n=1 Tax=Cellulomonas sp. JH27-2 TaxID=2774139 RepID=UPI001784B072|nr:glycoside hydrolase family 15 protein [Cellulomonas sp. JH27-2]MBD8058171.1 glycoside hydrolase family 15 protein [Cellulomonas sp. JH27-2]
MTDDVPPWAEFPPHVLREYAVLADGRRGALVGPRGDVAWLCAPRWDSPGVISAMVGGAGVYAVTPTEPFVWGGSYEPGTLVWRSGWTTATTSIDCLEAMAYPGDDHRVVLLRRIRAGDRDASVRVVLDLRAGFGEHPMRDVARGDGGLWTARTGDLRMRWRGGQRASVDDAGRLVAHLVVPAGETHDLVLEISDRELPAPADADELWDRTRATWADAVPTFERSAAPREARHAYAVLRGLTAPGGGMVAAATLGLPERIRAKRNYDYRYVWLRDQAYAGLAAGVDEPHPLLDDAVAFTVARVLEHGPDLSPGYCVDGSAIPHESTLGLPGYPGGRDVVGNWVRDQFQLDALGEVLQLFAAAHRLDRLDADGHRAVDVAIDVVGQRWTQPDAGIWELGDAWWTQSRLSAVAGLRAVAGTHRRADDLADAILSETDRRCLDPAGWWRRSPDHDGTDASLVLPPVRGALAADDPRTVATLAQVTRELARAGFVYRFRPDERPLGSAEGAFVLCGFMMALAHLQQRDDVAAFRWFERSVGVAGSPGILAEEYDVDERQLRGNLPQGFVHAMLLESAQRLAGAGPSRTGGVA